MANLLIGWAFMGAFYVTFVRGYSTGDPSRAAGFEYRRSVGDRFGFLPPTRDPIGMLLWLVTALGFLAALGFFLVGDRYIGASSGVMVSAFLLTLWRDDRWLKRQPEYQAAVEAASVSDDD